MTPSDLMLPYVILKRLNKFRKPQIAYVCSLKLTNEIWGLVGHYYVTGSCDRKLITPADSFDSIYSKIPKKLFPGSIFESLNPTKFNLVIIDVQKSVISPKPEVGSANGSWHRVP